MAHNPLIRKVPKMTGKTTGGHKSAGILDDHAVRKVVQSQEGYFKKNQGTDVGKPIVDIENWGGDWSGQEYGMLNLKSHDNTARLIKGFDDTTNTFTLTTQGNMSIAGSLELWDGVGSIRTNRNDLNLIPNHTSDVLTGHVVIENGGDAESLEVKGGSILAESIGVGTATANDPLHVVADASDDCIRVEEASGGEYWQLKVPNTGDLVFADSDVDRITFGDGTGNITTTGDISGGNVTSGADPGHTHTGSSLSGIDISDDTNLAVTSPIVLTDDTISLDRSHASTQPVRAFATTYRNTTGHPIIVFGDVKVKHYDNTNAFASLKTDGASPPVTVVQITGGSTQFSVTPRPRTSYFTFFMVVADDDYYRIDTTTAGTSTVTLGRWNEVDF